MKTLFQILPVPAVACALAAMWTTGSFENVDDLSAYRGGGSCEKRTQVASCGSYNSACIACNSSGVDLRCRDYSDPYNCIACNDGSTSNCGGSTVTGTAQYDNSNPPKFTGCTNWQSAGTCSRQYESATTGTCASGETC